MVVSKKGKIALLIGLIVVPVIFVGLLIVNWFVYPFSSATPNFADVEAVYNKLQIPSDWKIVEESENRGIAGRQCPVESVSMCFHIAKTYDINNITQKAVIEDIVLSSGCVSTTEKDNFQEGDIRESFTYECMSGSVRVFGTWENNLGEVSARFSTRSR